MTSSYSVPQMPTSTTEVVPLEIWGATDKGREREGNEDAIYPHSGSDTTFEPNPQRLAQKGRLLIVADGVGGARAGSQASQWAIRVAVEEYYDLYGPDLGTDLGAAIEKANASLYQYLQSTGTREAGSTMAAAVIHGNVLYAANVGDSRVYLLRDGQITPLTHDHTLTQQKVDRGIIRPEQAEMDPDHNILTRSMGAGPAVQVDVFPAMQLAPGDVVLLCSDGLTDMLGDEEIARSVNRNSSKRAAMRLIDAANKRGGLDNISVVIVRVGGEQLTGKGLLADIERMPGKQRRIVVVSLALIFFVAVAAWGWTAYGRRQATPTATATFAPAATATAKIAPTTTEPVATPTTVQPTDTTQPGKPTSTLAPTLTPTNTPAPLPTFTPTSEPMPTPTPESGPQPTQPPKPKPTKPPKPTNPSPTQPPPTNPPPTNPPPGEGG